MKRLLAALLITIASSLASDLRAQESVCNLFSHLEDSDGKQLVITGDLIISKDIAVLGAADCEYRYVANQFRWPTALLLHPSTTVSTAQIQQFQKAAGEADRLRSQGKTVKASASLLWPAQPCPLWRSPGSVDLRFLREPGGGSVARRL